MAKQTITKLICDLTGEEADETVEFGIDGQIYTIDLAGKHAAALRAFMEQYVAAGTRLGRSSTGGKPMLRSVRQTAWPEPPSSRSSSAADRDRNEKIREWANSHGYKVAERGRIAQHIVQKYEEQLRKKTEKAEGEARAETLLSLVTEEQAGKQSKPRARKAAPVKFAAGSKAAAG